jgi:hypothetical protein
MKVRFIGMLVVASFFTSCASIPQESVTLSQTLGEDLKVLHRAHRNIIEIHYRKIKDDINSFVDDVYAPFVIHHVLKMELKAYKEGNISLYGSIIAAGENEGKTESEAALKDMNDFQLATRKRVEKKRAELLSPIIKQEIEVVMAVNQSYENVIYANSTITGHLQSIRKVKEAQREALSMVGIAGADSLITNSLVKVSEQVGEALKKGKEIDVKSNDALKKLEEISKQIKSITNKTK